MDADAPAVMLLATANVAPNCEVPNMLVPDPISLAMKMIKQGQELLSKAADLLNSVGGGTPSTTVVGAITESKAGEGMKAAYASLLPKLVALSVTIHEMSDAEYREWQNRLTADEFFEFIKIQDTQETFQAAVSEGKRMAQVPFPADGVNCA